MTNEQLTLIYKVAANHLTKWTIWKEKRLYIKDTRIVSIYGTKKCQQNVYVDLTDGSLHCYTDCPAQGNIWIDNENARVIDALTSFARLLRIVLKLKKVESIDVVLNNVILEAEPTQGYFTTWREERVAINRFGKLATRNRQFLIFFSGNKNNAPKNFIELPKDIYDLISGYSNSEAVMLEPYQEASNKIQFIIDLKLRMKEIAANN